jgi:2,4-dienoyl-CoA reductase-like NADH-dependent reductase (Old Yellow Enzyme family)
VLEANAVHPSASMTSDTIAAHHDGVIPYYEKLAAAVHPYGTKMFEPYKQRRDGTTLM